MPTFRIKDFPSANIEEGQPIAVNEEGRMLVYTRTGHFAVMPEQAPKLFAKWVIETLLKFNKEQREAFWKEFEQQQPPR